MPKDSALLLKKGACNGESKLILESIEGVLPKALQGREKSIPV